jgi:response regulator NasT
MIHIRMAANRVSDRAMRFRILLVAGRAERAELLEQALAAAGHETVGCVGTAEDFAAHVQALHPDVLILEIEAPTAEILQRLERLLQEQPLPVVVFADRSAPADIQATVKAGVGAFVVDGLRPGRVVPVLDAARARFLEFQALRRERDAAVLQLAERKTVERAKGILMRRRRLAEDEAYTALRKLAMDRNKRLIEVAESIVTAEELLTQD